ncbi:MAG: hypothetical protein KBC16_01970 [Candidatus Pacebacteria bacterium]|nr:hypothetical protein [Candidatus Paceibacterota bacterium]
MKKLIFSAIAVCALMVAGTASAAESRFFVKRAPPEPAPKPTLLVMAPTPVVWSNPDSALPEAWVNPDTVGTAPWSFLVQNAEPNMNGRRFEQVGAFTTKDVCENERADVAEGANITYVSEACFLAK